MGRRWGKTTLGGAIGLSVLANHGKAAWVVPEYKNGRSLWRYVTRVCGPLAAAKILDVSQSERMVTTHLGGLLGIYSGDNIDSIRNEWFHVVIIDEAARIKEEARTDAILPTLADTGGDEICISTPKGINWFCREFNIGKDDMRVSASWNAPTSANPFGNIRATFERVRQMAENGLYPVRSFRQEWLAEFIADGSYFQNVDACCVLDKPESPDDHRGHTFGLGIDWGKSNDWTRGTIGCRECDRVVDWFGFNGLDYTIQRGRIKEYSNRWSNLRILPERNSIGEPNIEMLAADGLIIESGPDFKPGFQTTATTKPTLIEQLSLALLRGKKYPREYAEEFRAYEVTTGPNGQPKFSAPDGMHDDRVISAALENWIAVNSRIQLWV